MNEKTKRIIILLFALLITIPLVILGYVYYQMNAMYDGTSDSTSIEEDYGSIIVSDKITNILLIGTDERSKDERGRADAIMIATIDEKHRGIKITSIARDTYVDIPTKNRKEKINHAYSYGGASLLKETVESNFDIEISNYVRVNFNSFTEIIDALGGLELDVKKSELNELNKFIPECYEASSKKKPIKYIDEEGKQTLNGYQALSYARIRKNDSAIERDRRQREVMQSLMNEFSRMNLFEVPKVINAITKYVTTDMKPSEMLKYAQKVLKMGNFEIKQLEFPMAEYSNGGIIDGKGWVLQFNEKKCIPLLHEFIFESSYDSSVKSDSSWEDSMSEDEKKSDVLDFNTSAPSTDNSDTNNKKDDYINNSNNNGSSSNNNSESSSNNNSESSSNNNTNNDQDKNNDIDYSSGVGSSSPDSDGNTEIEGNNPGNDSNNESGGNLGDNGNLEELPNKPDEDNTNNSDTSSGII